MGGETRIALAVALGILTVVLDTTIAVVAVPRLMSEFDTSLTTMSWMTTAFVLAVVATMGLAAHLGRRFGYRRVLLCALVAFALASLWAACARGVGDLLAARAAQGMAGGLINPLGMTIALSAVPPARRGRVGALLGLPVLVGPVLGPILAGTLIDSVGWRTIFAITVPPALLSAFLVRRYAPVDEAGAATRPDVLGIALLIPGSVAVVLGLAGDSLPAAARFALCATGLAGIIAFASRRPRRTDLLDVTLLRSRACAMSILVVALTAAAYFGSMLMMPTYVQVIRGDSALMAGALSIPVGLATGVSLQICTRLIDRVPARRIVVTGLLIATGAAAAIAATLSIDLPYPVLMIPLAALGLGIGGVLMPTITSATRVLTGADLASGTTMLNLTSQLAAAVGTAGVTVLFSTLATGRAPQAAAALDRGVGLGALRAVIGPDIVDAQRITYAVLALIFASTAVIALRGLRVPTASPAAARRPEVAR